MVPKRRNTSNNVDESYIYKIEDSLFTEMLFQYGIVDSNNFSWLLSMPTSTGSYSALNPK